MRFSAKCKCLMACCCLSHQLLHALPALAAKLNELTLSEVGRNSTGMRKTRVSLHKDFSFGGDWEDPLYHFDSAAASARLEAEAEHAWPGSGNP